MIETAVILLVTVFGEARMGVQHGIRTTQAWEIAQYMNYSWTLQTQTTSLLRRTEIAFTGLQMAG